MRTAVRHYKRYIGEKEKKINETKKLKRWSNIECHVHSPSLVVTEKQKDGSRYLVSFSHFYMLNTSGGYDKSWCVWISSSCSSTWTFEKPQKQLKIHWSAVYTSPKHYIYHDLKCLRLNFAEKANFWQACSRLSVIFPHSHFPWLSLFLSLWSLLIPKQNGISPEKIWDISINNNPQLLTVTQHLYFTFSNKQKNLQNF